MSSDKHPDLQAAIRQAIWDVLVEDETLAEIMGVPPGEGQGKPLAPRVHHVMAPRQHRFPYLVYRVRMRSEGGPEVGSGTLYLDAWDHSMRFELLSQVRGRLMTLLDERVFHTDEGRLALWWMDDGPQPEEEEEIQHWTSVWDLRYTRLKEVSRILGR